MEETLQEERTSWRALIKKMGKQAFELSEMERLGFWPPTEAARLRTENAMRELKELQKELLPLRARERELEKLISSADDIAGLLAEARTLRIERVRQEREERKVRKAQEKIERAAHDAQWRKTTLPYLGRGVSAGLRYENGDDEKLRVLALPILHSAESVADALGVTTGKLAWLTYHRGAAALDHYRRWNVPKKSGGMRGISSPKPQLRAAQQWILENVLSRVPTDEAAMAFLPKTNIRDNAARHAHAPGGPNVVVRIDLKDFFPSVTFGRAKNVFVSLGYNEGVASLFGLLCTEAPRLEIELDGKRHHVALAARSIPQGAPTSPALTNVLCRRLDARLRGLAVRFGFVYTRYADDLVFSSAAKDANAPVLQSAVYAIAEDCGFVVNAEKTAMMRPHRRQSVTGLVVNAASTRDGKDVPNVRVSRRDRHKFRAFLHNYEKLGREAMSEKTGRDALAYARGYLSFVHMVSPAQEAEIRARHPWLTPRETA